MKYLITGGTGFIGKKLCSHLLSKNNKIIVLTRDKLKARKALGNNIELIEDVSEIDLKDKIDVIINLAGENIAQKRWTDEQKKRLIESRISITRSIINLLKNLQHKPKHFISASAIGFYGSQGDEILTENSKPINEFTNELCIKWENEAKKAEKLKIITSIIRLGVVLGKKGGTIERMILPFKLGGGGKIGRGEQYFSWIHIDDLIRGIDFIILKKLAGIYNFTSPNPVTSAEFTKCLADSLNRPHLFPMPAIIVKALFGEMGETLLLNGQRVVPKKITDKGFDFKYPNIHNALNEITN